MYMYLSHECGLQVLLLQYYYSCVHNLTVKSPSKIGFYEINFGRFREGVSMRGEWVRVLGHGAEYFDFYLRVIPVLIQLGTLS